MIIKPYLRATTIVIAASALTPFLALICTFHLKFLRSGSEGPFFTPTVTWELGLCAAGFLAVCIALAFLGRHLHGALREASVSQSQFLDDFTSSRAAWAIMVAAGLSLFLELALIRWQVAIFPLLSYYKNFSLLACFAGLGLGYALADRKHVPLVAVVPLLGWQILSQMVLKYGLGDSRLVSLLATPFWDQTSFGLIVARTRFQFGVIYFTLVTLFLLTALALIPIGQLCGRLMQRIEPLRAYGFNLLGSLFGVLLMLLMSFAWTTPGMWFALAFIVIVAFTAFALRPLLFTACAALLCLALLAWPGSIELQTIFSPYQVIERGYTSDGLTTLRAAGHYFQRVYSFDPAYVEHANDETTKALVRYYEMPYRIYGKPGRVAVVGAGTGNDVAAALEQGMTHVDAVEIDPAIVAIGRYAHPQRPYSDPRVRTIVNDARTFFRSTQDTYDLIVYGLLDSHAVLSHAASVRLESFVYTVQGLREARARLNPDGMLVLTFYVMTPEMGHKIYRMLEEAFDGRPPVCLESQDHRFYTYLQANNADVNVPASILEAAHYVDIGERMRAMPRERDLSTDDWPFLYMPKRMLPQSFYAMMAIVGGATLLLVLLFLPGKPRANHAVFFLLGAGFMLVETKGITELGLQFGNTWQVIGFIIAGILLMSFLANYTVLNLKVRRPEAAIVLLLLSLALGLAVAMRGEGPSPTLAGRIGTLALLTCPVFFSGIVFSTVLRTDANIAGAMAANLLGAMCGGILEYTSMRFGYPFLYILAIALYAAAAVAFFIARRTNLSLRT